jgi:hypothetical protein
MLVQKMSIETLGFSGLAEKLIFWSNLEIGQNKKI